MSRTPLHVKVDVHHRTEGGGTYIARYRIRGTDRYLEGYGHDIGEALEQLGRLVQYHPDRGDLDYTRDEIAGKVFNA